MPTTTTQCTTTNMPYLKNNNRRDEKQLAGTRVSGIPSTAATKGKCDFTDMTVVEKKDRHKEGITISWPRRAQPISSSRSMTSMDIGAVVGKVGNDGFEG
ncbi:hypothetical protein Tco_1438396 [Tanacetum coccineum]